MQEQDKSEKKLNDYFNLARNENPVISAEEAVQVITGASASKANKFNWKSYKLWLLVIVFSISTYAVFVFTEDNSIKKTGVATAADNVAANVADESTLISTDNPTTPIEQITADTNLIDSRVENDQPNKVEAEATTNPSKPVEKPIKNETYYFQGNAKVNFEMDGAFVEMQINDEVIQLKIDGEIIKPENFNQYATIIEKGKMMKAESAKASEMNNNKNNNEEEKNKLIMNELISKLKNDQLVNNESHFVFRLTGTNMYIDELEQSDSLFIEYKTLYERVSGKTLNIKSNIKIKR